MFLGNSFSKYLPSQVLGKQKSNSPNDNGIPTGDGLYFTDMNGNVLQNGEDISSSYIYDPKADGRDGNQGVYNLKKEVAMPQEFLTRFGAPEPTGPMTLPELVKYTGGANNGVTEGEFNQLTPQVQKAVLNDPSTFLRGQLGFGPKPGGQRTGLSTVTQDEAPYAKYAVGQNQGGSQDLLSVGAAGGSRDLSKLYWDPKVGLIQAPNNYMPAKDTTDFMKYAPYLIGALAGGVGLATGALTAPVAGATSGALSGTYSGFDSSGGDFGATLKGGVKGAAVGYVGGSIGESLNTAVGFNPTIADATWSAGATPLSGAAVSLGREAVIGGVKGGFSSGINGGNIGEGVVGGAKGAGIGSVSSLAPSILPDIGNSTVNRIIGGGLKGGVSSALSGGDFATGALNGGINSALPSTGNSLLDMLLNKGVNSALFSSSPAPGRPKASVGTNTSTSTSSVLVSSTSNNSGTPRAQKAAANFMQILSRNHSNSTIPNSTIPRNFRTSTTR